MSRGEGLTTLCRSSVNYLPKPLPAASTPRLALARPPAALDGDTALVSAIREGQARALTELFEVYAPVVERILASVLGADGEIPDLVSEVFLRAIEGISSLKDPGALRGWLAQIAVFTARERIRYRSRRRWLRFFGWDELPEAPAVAADHEAQEAVRAVYAVLDAMPVDDRLVFTLRYIEGMDLPQLAAACDTSLSTAKRRLARADKRFALRAQSYPVLRERLEGATP